MEKQVNLRLQLIKTLCSIMPEQLEMIIFALGVPPGIIPPIQATQGMRVSALLAWASSVGGCGLEQVETIYLEVVATSKQNANTTENPGNFADEGLIGINEEIELEYNLLKDYLTTQEWKLADLQTAKVILKVLRKDNYWNINRWDIENFPDTELERINQLWLDKSDAHFGFSVQKNIFLLTKSQRDIVGAENLAEQLGWRDGNGWLNYEQLTFDLLAPAGHLPVMGWKWNNDNVILGLGTGSLGGVWVGGGIWWFFSWLYRLETCNL